MESGSLHLRFGSRKPTATAQNVESAGTGWRHRATHGGSTVEELNTPVQLVARTC